MSRKSVLIHIASCTCHRCSLKRYLHPSLLRDMRLREFERMLRRDI